jgi:uncharacterized protein YjeT (DUF2065 family)
MPMIAIIFSALFAGLGATAVFLPDTFIEVARELSTPIGLLVAAAVRVVFGAALLLAAQESRAPNALRVFGVVILIAGLATPWFGAEVARRLLAVAAQDGGAMLRIFGTIAVALGVLFVMALSPRTHMPSRQ